MWRGWRSACSTSWRSMGLHEGERAGAGAAVGGVHVARHRDVGGLRRPSQAPPLPDPQRGVCRGSRRRRWRSWRRRRAITARVCPTGPSAALFGAGDVGAAEPLRCAAAPRGGPWSARRDRSFKDTVLSRRRTARCSCGCWRRASSAVPRWAAGRGERAVRARVRQEAVGRRVEGCRSGERFARMRRHCFATARGLRCQPRRVPRCRPFRLRA